jgi:hypothetical protein
LIGLVCESGLISRRFQYGIQKNPRQHTKIISEKSTVTDDLVRNYNSEPLINIPYNFPFTSSFLCHELKNQALTQTIKVTSAYKAEKLRYMLSELPEIFKAGRLKTVIDRQFPLEKVAEAHRNMGSGHKRGILVIVTSSN